MILEFTLYLPSGLTCCEQFPSHSWEEDYCAIALDRILPVQIVCYSFLGAGSAAHAAYVNLLLCASQGLLYFNKQLRASYHFSLQDVDCTFGKDRSCFYRKINDKFVVRNLAGGNQPYRRSGLWPQDWQWHRLPRAERSRDWKCLMCSPGSQADGKAAFWSQTLSDHWTDYRNAAKQALGFWM